MKKIIFAFLILGISIFANAQTVKIHSHNDYQHSEPLFEALRCKVFSLEADVFLKQGILFVAHSKKEISADKTLSSMYLDPLIACFNTNKGTVLANSTYSPVLFIDIKKDGEKVLKELVHILTPYQDCFDRTKNPHAVQIIISGDRGAIVKWTTYPSFIAFDGRLDEVYNSEQLKKVAIYSAAYNSYSSPVSDFIQAREAVKKAHQLGKPFRFWGTPDNEEDWRKMNAWGVDLINTDQVAACTRFFIENN